ncbi:MAG: DUF3024 domain-containing protein [Saccharospirillum sp.]
MTTPVLIPEFVQHQALRAWQRLVEQYPSAPLASRLHKTALIIDEIGPHPNQTRQVALPVALINWRQDHWRLYFRSQQGRWLLMPDRLSSKDPRPLLSEVFQDTSGVFWRQ